MKKIKFELMLATIISAFLTGIVFAIEGLSAFTTGKMPIGREYMGGECGGQTGIGWEIFTTYPMSDGVHPESSHTAVTFNPNVFRFLLVTWLVTFVVLFVIKYIKAKKKQG